MTQDEMILELLKQVLELKRPDYIGDLIKIGLPLLGASIGAIIGYLSARRAAEINRDAMIAVERSTRLTEMKKEYGARRSYRFENLLDNLDAFSQCLADYVAAIKNALEDQAKSELSDEAKADAMEREVKFRDSFLKLLSAESGLLALGHAGAQEDLRAFGETAQDIYSTVHLKSELSIEQIAKKMTHLQQLRKDLILKIGQREAEWWEQAIEGA